MTPSSWQRTGRLPRLLTPDCLWTGGCLEAAYGHHTHAGFSMFVVRGTEKSVIVDTGHAHHWKQVERDVEMFLDGRPLDYIFPTHGELPHAGLMSQWLHKYPDAMAVGRVGDYHLFYPDLKDRFRVMDAGESLDLGGRHLLFLPAVWRDLPDSLWAFETVDRILFAADGFAHLHPHDPAQCDAFTSELPPPDLKLIQYFNEHALQWTRFADARETFEDLDRLLRILKPRLIAEAHGGVIDTTEAVLPLFKQGMITEAALANLRASEVSAASG